jgi:hypothetical protein
VLFTSLVSPVDVAMARTAQPGFVFFIGLLWYAQSGELGAVSFAARSHMIGTL